MTTLDLSSKGLCENNDIDMSVIEKYNDITFSYNQFTFFPKKITILILINRKLL